MDEQLASSILHHFPNGAVILFDRDLRYVLAEGAGLADAGLSKEMLEGNSIWELFPQEVCQVLEPNYRAALKGSSSTFEMNFGERIYLVYALPILNEAGEISHGMAVTQDITERVRAHKSLERSVRDRRLELSSLLEVSRNVSSTLELNPLLGLILDQLKTVVEYSGAGILILDGEHLVARAERGRDSDRIALQQRFSSDNPLDRRVITGRNPVTIADVQDESELAQAFRDACRDRVTGFDHIRSWMGVPMILKERVIGILTLDHNQPRAYTERHEELAMVFASQAAVALENARLFEAEQRRAEQFRVMGEVSRSITSILAVDDLLKQIVRLIHESFGYHHVHLGLIEENQVVFKASAPSAEIDEGTRSCEAIRLKVGEQGLNGWVAATGEALLVPDVRNDPRYVHAPGSLTRSELALPLKVRSQVIGVLNIESRRLNAFDRSDLTLFQSLADQAAIAIENANLYREAREKAAVEERHRLSRDLHDSVTQMLYSLILFAGSLRKLLEKGETSILEDLIGSIERTAQQALREMRLLVFELRPTVLEEEGLSGALRLRLDSVENRAGIETHLLVDDGIRLSNTVEEELYRIALEALNNALKHAFATSVVVRYQMNGGVVEFEVADDGSGFDPQLAGRKGGMGLMGMRERADRIGGTLDFYSVAGVGSKITVRLPAHPGAVKSF